MKQQRPSKSISQAASLKKVLVFISPLLLLLGCNNQGSAPATTTATQSPAVENFYARRAIILDAFKHGKNPHIPKSLDLATIQSGTQSGSLLGEPAYMALNNSLLVGNPNCVNIGPVTSATSYSAPSQKLSILSTNSTQSGSQQSAIAAALSAGVGLFTANSATAINNSSLFSNTTIGFEYNYSNYGSHNASYTSATLSDLILKSYLDPTGTSVNSSFIKQCGDSFVYSENYGAAIVAKIEISFDSSSEASSFSQNTKLSYGTLADLSTSVSSSKNSTNSNSSVSIKVTQLGGKPGSLPASLQKLGSCTLATFTDCEDYLNQVNDYAKTLQAQILDTNVNPPTPITGAYIYNNPRLKKYTELVNLNSNQNLPPADAAAIDTVQNIYLHTLMLYYGFQSYPKILTGTALSTFNADIYNKIINREKYIANSAQPCYVSPSACSSTILPKIISDLNSVPDLVIDASELTFYSTQLQSDNFLNLNSLFGSAKSDKNGKTLTPISVAFIPSIQSKDGDIQYVNQFPIPQCTLENCAAGKVYINIKKQATTPPTALVTYPNYGGLQATCSVVEDSGNFTCSGSTRNQYSKYLWKDDLIGSLIGSLTSSQLNEYAKPSATLN